MSHCTKVFLKCKIIILRRKKKREKVSCLEGERERERGKEREERLNIKQVNINPPLQTHSKKATRYHRLPKQDKSTL